MGGVKTQGGDNRETDILLISPPTTSVVKSVVGVTDPPLDLAYLVSTIRDEHDVRIVDSLTEDFAYKDVEKVIKR